MADWVIVTPRYLESSFGIRLLHKMAWQLRQSGRSVALAFIASNDPNVQEVIHSRDPAWRNPEWDTPPALYSTIKGIRNLPTAEQPIVMYPDVITGNPLGASKVVRHLGNREGYCNGKPIEWGLRDCVSGYSRILHSSPHAVLFDLDLPSYFHDRGALPLLSRMLDLTYIGKGHLYGEVHEIERDGKLSVGVPRNWPPTQRQFAELLRSCRYFDTFDSFSAANAEAVLCGSIPYVRNWGPWKREEVMGMEHGGFPCLDDAHQDLGFYARERLDFIGRLDALRKSYPARFAEWATRCEQWFA